MKLSIAILAIGMTGIGLGQTPSKAVGQTATLGYFTSEDDRELFEISLSLATRICAANPHASPYIPLPMWTRVPCYQIGPIMKRHTGFPDFIDHMHADEKARQAALDELQRTVNNYLSNLPKPK